MKLYDQIFNVVKDFRKFFSPGPVTNADVSVLIKNMPLIPKFKIEQDDSLDKMIFYAVMVLGIVVVFVYWGGNLV